jgi:hypothetical protein
MNHEQWEALKAATQGHTPGPWFMSGPYPATDITTRDGFRVLIGNSTTNREANSRLAAAAAALIAEVERLRGFLECIAKNGTPISKLIAQDALNGAEVPK